jgi:pimeloyl-ACP methyl ester carboxylesterase
MASLHVPNADRIFGATPPAELGPRSRSKRTPRLHFVSDGPFAEAKELVVAAWPVATRGVRPLPVGRYASVNGLRMYYEIHGSRRHAEARSRPLVVLHAALTTIDSSFSAILPTLSRDRQVIAIEHQAHGRTSDVARPMSFRWLAEDTAELLRQLGIGRADVMGYSMGGAIALTLALLHPELVEKLMVVSGSFHTDGYSPDFMTAIAHLTTIEDDHTDRMRRDFQRVGARPEQWPRALSRVQELVLADEGSFELDQLRHVRAETLVVGGEYGVIRPEHTKQLVELVPNAKLELLPGNDHDPQVLIRSAQLANAFLDRAREASDQPGSRRPLPARTGSR